MPRPYLSRAWSKGSAVSTSSISARSHSSDLSGHSGRTQYTNATSYSYTKPIVKHYDTDRTEYHDDEPSQGEHEQGIDPRASSDTYASTTVSEKETPQTSNLWPLLRQTCYQPDALGCTPSEFAELFPSTRRILIQHDDTTPDGNLNLRADTEMTVRKGHKVKLTLFHFRMYDLAERHFSLRRYQRQSGREVCSSKRKYVKPSAKPIRPAAPPRKSSFGVSFPKINFRKALTAKSASQKPQEDKGDDVDEISEVCGPRPDVEATVPTDNIRIEFSNYAQVELNRDPRNDKSVYDFEYWGETYSWRRRVYKDGSETVFSLEMFHSTTGACLAHITPDKLSEKQRRKEAVHGGWIPSCSMRIMEEDISSDLGDVLIATGLISLTDDCIRRHWQEAHRS
ncbi:hypothetical protein EDD36DRAFT_23736 [Exophiala viscosa]|uniref:Uncharacterized protein n=1 Tax=Exophiala viscosa TaxID=2486360 RepID=A0AAN6E5C0_9EURO|nr:hypothetical protein EDD36DRAFT_23736 [Exophiala viscosa]